MPPDFLNAQLLQYLLGNVNGLPNQNSTNSTSFSLPRSSVSASPLTSTQTVRNTPITPRIDGSNTNTQYYDPKNPTLKNPVTSTTNNNLSGSTSQTNAFGDPSSTFRLPSLSDRIGLDPTQREVGVDELAPTPELTTEGASGKNQLFNSSNLSRILFGTTLDQYAQGFGEAIGNKDAFGAIANGVGIGIRGTRIAGLAASIEKAQRRRNESSEEIRNRLLQQLLYGDTGNPLVIAKDGGEVKKKYRRGGTVKPTIERLLTGEYVTGLSKQLRDEANAEVEDGEYIKNPTGHVQEVLGKKHDDKDKDGQGGELMNLEIGTRILSDDLKIGGKNKKKFQKDFDLKLNAKDSYADFLRKYTKKIKLAGTPDSAVEEQHKYIKSLSKNEEIDHDPTKRINTQFLAKKIKETENKKVGLEIARSGAFDVGFEAQESDKSEEDNVIDENDRIFARSGGEVTLSMSKVKKMAAAMGLDEGRAMELFEEFKKGGVKKRNSYHKGGDVPHDHDEDIFATDFTGTNGTPENLQQALEFYRQYFQTIDAGEIQESDLSNFIFTQNQMDAIREGVNVGSQTRVGGNTFGDAERLIEQDLPMVRAISAFMGVDAGEINPELTTDFTNLLIDGYTQSNSKIIPDFSPNKPGDTSDKVGGRILTAARKAADLDGDTNLTLNVDTLARLKRQGQSGIDKINEQFQTSGSKLRYDDIKDLINPVNQVIRINKSKDGDEAPTPVTKKEVKDTPSPDVKAPTPDQPDPTAGIDVNVPQNNNLLGNGITPFPMRLFRNPSPVTPSPTLSVNLERLDNAALSDLPIRNEANNAFNFLRSSTTGLNPVQRQAALQNGIANIQQNTANALGQLRAQEAQLNLGIDQTNLQQSNTERQLNLQLFQQANQADRKALAARDENVERVRDARYALNVAAQQHVLNQQTLKTLFNNTTIGEDGSILQKDKPLDMDALMAAAYMQQFTKLPTANKKTKSTTG